MIGTLIFSYLLAALYFFLGKRAEPSFAYVAFIYVYMWIPGIFAWIKARKEKIHLPFKFSVLSFLKTALFAFLLIVISSSILAFLYKINPLIEPYLSQGPLMLVFTVLVYLAFAMVIGPLMILGQEMMFRGYLHEKWKHIGALKASCFIGLSWGIWYAPLVFLQHNYPNRHPLIGILIMIALMMSLSPFLFYLRETHKSIMIPVAFQTILSAFFGASFLIFETPNDLLVGPTSIIAIALYALTSFVALKKLR